MPKKCGLRYFSSTFNLKSAKINPMSKIIKSLKLRQPPTELESAAFGIVQKLQNAGFETYFAGGAVRDELLGIEAHDIDIATSAKPEEVKKIFAESYDRGKAFGVVAVKIDNFEFEVATFRQDIGIADHRRPQSVKFTNAEEDAKRRDFTVNGLFYDPIKQEVIDFIGGLKDLDEKIIRFIGEPQARIEEDYLRMMRAVRFACRLNFEIEKKTFSAIKDFSDKILEISVERLREEMSRILLCARRAEAITMLDELGLLNQLFPELETTKNVPQPQQFHAEGDVWTHILLALKNIGNPPAGGNSEELVWTVLLHDIAKPQTIGYRDKPGRTSITFFEHDVKSAQMAGEILERFKFSHHFIEAVEWAIRQHMRIVSAFRGMSERKQKRLFCDKNIQLLLDLTKADLSASLRPNGKPEMDLYEDAVKMHKKFAREISAEKSQLEKFDLVTGQDIMDLLKIPAGPKVGEIKDQIEQMYLEGKINTRKEAIESVKEFGK